MSAQTCRRARGFFDFRCTNYTQRSPTSALRLPCTVHISLSPFVQSLLWTLAGHHHRCERAGGLLCSGSHTCRNNPILSPATCCNGRSFLQQLSLWRPRQSVGANSLSSRSRTSRGTTLGTIYSPKFKRFACEFKSSVAASNTSLTLSRRCRNRWNQ